uniref:Uncharacterized protein n=2 Tax=Sus scrofa TaxID=9823 RepID=A0A8D1ZTT9_PIG
MEFEKRLMETEQHWTLSASERYVMDSHMERDGMDSAAASGMHLMGEEKHQEKNRCETYMTDSDSEPCMMDSDSKRYGLVSASMKCLVDTKTFQLSTDTERHWMDSWSERRKMDLDSESLCMASNSVKYMMKAENCQRGSDLERFQMGLRSESERCWTDSEIQQLDFYRYWDHSRRYQCRSRFQGSSRRCHDDLQKHWDKFEEHHIDTDFEKHRVTSENKRYQNKFESERHHMEMERKQCLIQSENERLQMDDERGKYLINSDGEKEQNEAQRLGARRKDNRPQGFWRPIFLSPACGQGKETEEQHFVQQIDNRIISRIQLVRYPSDDKTVRFKEVAPTLSDKQNSRKKLKEKHSHNLFIDPNTFVDNKHHKNASHKISVCKSCHTGYRYQQIFQSSRSEMNPIHLISAEDYTSEVSTPVYHPTSLSSWSSVHPNTHRNNIYTLDTGAQACSKCFVGISNSSFHKCLMNTDDDSDPDCPLHLQISLDSKYSLSPKSIRHRKTSRDYPLSRSLDPKHPVGIRCPLHWKDSKYSLGSTSYLHYESCSALQNLMGSTITRTFPMNPQNNMDHRSTSGPDNVINTSSTSGLESRGKFNLTAKFENDTNLDDETKLTSTGNLKDKANVKDKPLVKDDTDHEDETDSEDEEDHKDETDPEDENIAKDKKDPKDRSDPDDTDPKDSNAENDAGTNNGSDASGDADPANGADSNCNDNSNNGTDSNSEPDSNNYNITNNDANIKYSTDSEEDKHTNISDNVSGLDNGVNQDCTADSDNGTNPNYTSGLQNGTGLDYTSGSSNGNNGPGLQNIRPIPRSPGSSNNGSGPSINGLDLNNKPYSNYNSRPSNATSHNAALSPDKDADSIHETKPISAAGHNYTAIPNCGSNLDYVPGFTHAVGSNFAVSPNYITRNSFAASISSTASTLNVIDTSNTTSCIGTISPTYTTGTSCASDTNHDPRFTHVIGSNFVINPTYDSINTHNVCNSTSTRNINNISEPELEINSSSSILNIVCGNDPIIFVGTNYISTPEKLTTHKFSNPSKLDRNYAVFDDHKFGACLNDYAGSMDSASLKHATDSKDVLDTEESGFLKDFSEVQNPIGIKDPASLNFHSNSNIPLPSFDIIVEAEPPDVVKFAIPSGAVNQFFKSTLTGSSTTLSEVA